MRFIPTVPIEPFLWPTLPTRLSETGAIPSALRTVSRAGRGCRFRSQRGLNHFRPLPVHVGLQYRPAETADFMQDDFQVPDVVQDE